MAIRVQMNILAALVVVVLLAAATRSAAQGQIPSCASKLEPCVNYLNSTKPPESCCGPMKEAVKNELPCLCSLFNSPDLLKAFSINVTQAVQLPKYCGVSSDTSICSKVGATPPSSTKNPPGAGDGSSGAGDKSSGKKDNSGAFGGISWIGTPGLVSLLLLAWSMMGL